MNASRKLLGAARRVLDALAAGLLVAVLAVTTAQVAARYLFGVAMPWGEELVRLLFIWLVFIGAARTRHMNVDILPNMLPRRGRRAHEIACALFGAGLLIFIVHYALNLVELTVHDRYSALGVSVQYLYWAAVVGCVLWIALSLVEAVMGAPEGESGGADEDPQTLS